MKRENLVCTANFSMKFWEFVYLINMVSIDMARSIWTLYVIFMRVKVSVQKKIGRPKL